MKKWKRIIAGITAGVMLACTQVSAGVDLNAKYAITTNELENWPAGPELMADTGVLMDADTGVVLYDKGAHELRYPASITKLMTLLVAVEHADLNETVTFTETGIRDIAPDSGNIGMQLGETMSMEDCLYAMILYSANEVSAQIAEYVGGTEQAFIDMMNERAAKIGCENTHFMNASGLPDENQYTTAYDMALIFREGLKNKTFRKIINTRSYVVKATNKNSQDRPFQTHHPLFSELSGIFYPSCIGGKSGMTNDAGHTLVTGAEENGVTYITVVMRDVDINQAGVDSKALFDYGYQNFHKEEVEGGSVLLPSGVNTDSLTKQEETVGGVLRQGYYLSGHLVGTGSVPEPTPESVATPTPAQTEQEAPVQEQETVQEHTEDTTVDSEREETGLSKTARVLLAVMACMVILLIILCILLGVKNRRRGRR